MSHKIHCIITSLFIVMLVGGCASSQPKGIVGMDQLPKDWFTLPTTSWKYQTLPYGISSSIDHVREDMLKEQSSTGYRFYGRYSQGLSSRMASVSLSADSAFINSYAVISENLSPEMKGLATTHDDEKRDRAVVNDANLRMIVDDWNRLWLWDGPSQLSSYHTINTTGMGP
jgi:hypothetical protein